MDDTSLLLPGDSRGVSAVFQPAFWVLACSPFFGAFMLVSSQAASASRKLLQRTAGQSLIADAAGVWANCMGGSD